MHGVEVAPPRLSVRQNFAGENDGVAAARNRPAKLCKTGFVRAYAPLFIAADNAQSGECENRTGGQPKLPAACLRFDPFAGIGLFFYLCFLSTYEVCRISCALCEPGSPKNSLYSRCTPSFSWLLRMTAFLSSS